MAIVTESMVTRARRKALQRILARTITGIAILAILAFVGLSIGLHVWAAKFDQQATDLVHELSKLRPGGTPKQDALTRLPGLKRVPRSEADGHEVYELRIGNSPQVLTTLRQVASISGRAGYTLAYLYGVRHWSLSIRVDFAAGVVSDIAYAARVSSSDAVISPTINVNVGSLQSFDEVPVSAESVASPEYRVTNFARWPDKDVTVAFTPNAQHEVLRHAFNVNFGCISELRGCWRAEQILPDAFLDKRVILKSAGLE